MTTIYYIRTEGNEDNHFQPVVCSYHYSQYIEVIKMLKKNGTPYTTWTEEICTRF